MTQNIISTLNNQFQFRLVVIFHAHRDYLNTPLKIFYFDGEENTFPYFLR